MHLRLLHQTSSPLPSSLSTIARLHLPSSILNLKPTSHSSFPKHSFHNTPSHLKSKAPQLPPRPTLPDSELKHTYLKGSGPGGQKINKTSSAVQLTHLPTGIVVKSQATRSQKQNHNIARKILAEKIEFLEKGDQSRKAKVIELKVKRKRGAEKKKRRKYRRLAGEKEGDGVGEGEEDGKGEGGEESEEIEEGERIEEVQRVEQVKKGETKPF